MARNIYIPSAFRDLTVGQEVVIDGGVHIYRKHTIARLSATSIWLEDGRRFTRTNGRLVGDNSTWHYTFIVTSSNCDRPMDWAELDAINAAKAAEQARHRRIHRLGETKWAHFTDAQLARLANEIAWAEAAYVECQAAENLQWELFRRVRGW